jgi:CheY-like chemotaxis protein
MAVVCVWTLVDAPTPAAISMAARRAGGSKSGAVRGSRCFPILAPASLKGAGSSRPRNTLAVVATLPGPFQSISEFVVPFGIDRRSDHSRPLGRPCLRKFTLCRVTGTRMASPSLQGRNILIVEDEPLIVMDMTSSLEITGAAITSTNTLKHALLLVEHDGLSAAILDHSLGDGNSSALCARLTERGVPFMIYSGYEHLDGLCSGAPHLMKPALAETLVAAVEDLINGPRTLPIAVPSNSD